LSHLDEKHEDLIQREIDGDISESERTALGNYVALNAEARSLQAGLTKLAEVLNRVEAVEPPSDLAKSVLAALPPRSHAPASSSVLRSRSYLARFPILKYGYALAAGLILGFALNHFLFNQTPTLSDSDVRGSMVPRIPISRFGSADHLPLNHDGVSGALNLRVSDSVAALEFDLNSQESVQFKVGFDGALIAFKGFDQQINNVDSFEAGSGHIIVQCRGKHHFTVLFGDLKTLDANLSIEVFISGKLVQKGNIQLPKSG
jgi:hypothetical protein